MMIVNGVQQDPIVVLGVLAICVFGLLVSLPSSRGRRSRERARAIRDILEDRW